MRSQCNLSCPKMTDDLRKSRARGIAISQLLSSSLINTSFLMDSAISCALSVEDCLYLSTPKIPVEGTLVSSAPRKESSAKKPCELFSQLFTRDLCPNAGLRNRLLALSFVKHVKLHDNSEDCLHRGKCVLGYGGELI